MTKEAHQKNQRLFPSPNTMFVKQVCHSEKNGPLCLPWLWSGGSEILSKGEIIHKNRALKFSSKKCLHVEHSSRMFKIKGTLKKQW